MSVKILNRILLKTSNVNNISRHLAHGVGDKTSLYDFHVANGGKMVNFAGYMLPVQYSDLGIAASHLHTRKSASVFDVSHMLQTYVKGKDAIECFESICTADIKNLADGSGSLTVFTNSYGGILDDLIVTKLSSDCLYVVSNAGRKAYDAELISETVKSFRARGKAVDVKFFDPLERALLAVQGPYAVNAVQALTKTPLNQLYFMNSIEATVGDIQDCRITRCGYTGEDGVEISIPANEAVRIAEQLLENKQYVVKLAGLGARDSLRLEAGLCLYGSDMDDKVTPVEAALTWLVAKRRRVEKNFPGADVILNQITNGCTRRRVGIRMEAGPPARHGVEIIINNQKVGEITSGCPSPSIGGNVAMGYIKEGFKKSGTNVELLIRGRNVPACVSKMPFLPSHYYMAPKKG